MLKRLALVLPLAFAVAPTPVSASSIDCAEHFPDGMAPGLKNERLAADARALCFSAFALLHSGITRTPLWIAEHLTRESITNARATPREGEFHAEARLTKDERAELSDYRRSGYDRGHMAPSANMPDEQAEAESYTLANIVPQAPELNRGLWAGIEEAARDLAVEEGEVYVVTGPLFEGRRLRRLKGRVVVPTGLFKAVHLPGRDEAGAYVVDNTDTEDWRTLSIAELEEVAGIDAFPGLPDGMREAAMRLPEPDEPRRSQSSRREEGILEMLRGLIR